MASALRIHYKTALASILLCLFLISFIVTNVRKKPAITVSTLNGDELPSTQIEDERFIVADLHACNAKKGGGVGNIVFEMISFASIAQQIGRTPAIYADSEMCLSKIRKYSQHMPGLAKGFAYVNRPWLFWYPHRAPRDQQCFEYFDAGLLFGGMWKNTIIATDLRYLQNYKFLESTPSYVIERRLEMTKNLTEMANQILVSGIEKDTQSHRLCVHTRRGDFVTEQFHLASENRSTVEGSLYIIEQLKRQGKASIHIVVLGQDHKWNTETFHDPQFSNYKISIANYGSDQPSMIDWAFAKKQCDTVYLTASISSYGYWLAYVSRGHDVYYRKAYSKYEPQQPVEIWPPQWKALNV